MKDLSNFRGMSMGNLDPLVGSLDFGQVSLLENPTKIGWLRNIIHVFGHVDYPQIALVSEAGKHPTMTFVTLLSRLWCDYIKLAFPDGLRTSYTMRAPHHTISSRGMFGKIGDQRYMPGELECAYGGSMVLFDFEQFNDDIKERLLVGSKRFDPSYIANIMPCLKVFCHTVMGTASIDEKLDEYRQKVSEPEDHLSLENIEKCFDLVIDMREVASSIRIHGDGPFKMNNEAIVERILAGGMT